MRAPPHQHPIVGTRHLSSFTEEELETGTVTFPFGQQAKAAVIFTADGYVATIFASADRNPPTAARATDQEAVALYRSMISASVRASGWWERLAT